MESIEYASDKHFSVPDLVTTIVVDYTPVEGSAFSLTWGTTAPAGSLVITATAHSESTGLSSGGLARRTCCVI